MPHFIRRFLIFPVRLVLILVLSLIALAPEVQKYWAGLLGLSAEDAGWWLQCAMSALLIFVLLITYRIFLFDLVRYLVEHLGQTAILILLLGMLYGQVGVSYGVPGIFWSEYGFARSFSAMAVTLLLAVLGINAFHFDPGKDRMRVRTELFLEKF